MRKIHPLLLGLEILIGYGPSMALWLVGITSSPWIIISVMEGDIGGIIYLYLFSIILGGIGLHGIFQLIVRLDGRQESKGIEAYRVHLFCGLCAWILFCFPLVDSEPWLGVYMLVPALVTAHFYWLCALEN